MPGTGETGERLVTSRTADENRPATRAGETARFSGNSSAALAGLRDLLARGDHGASTRLAPERELAATLGVGRRALRRALEVLEAEGRIWRQQGRGTFSGPPPSARADGLKHLHARTSPLEVMEARLQLEPALARLAALRATADDIERLRRPAARLAASGADDDLLELWDSAFHRCIAQAAGNVLLAALFDVIDRIRQEPSWRASRRHARSPGSNDLYFAQHERILGAILARDPAAAEAAMRDHLRTLQDRLLTTGSSEPEPTVSGLAEPEPADREPKRG